MLAAPELFEREGTLAPDDEVDLGRGRPDRVELGSVRERLPSCLAVHVEARRDEVLDELIPRGWLRVDDDVHVAGRAWLTVVRARQRSRDHEWDPCSIEPFDDEREKLAERHRLAGARRA
ncbi:MAG: hypothetical protein H0V73_02000 [Chloroflexi bacterium]|nr:hypothetical protein [Chloroflexota bacterium]